MRIILRIPRSEIKEAKVIKDEVELELTLSGAEKISHLLESHMVAETLDRLLKIKNDTSN